MHDSYQSLGAEGEGASPVRLSPGRTTAARTLFVLPVIIGYSFYAYRVFGGKASDLRYD